MVDSPRNGTRETAVGAHVEPSLNQKTEEGGNKKFGIEVRIVRRAARRMK